MAGLRWITERGNMHARRSINKDHPRRIASPPPQSACTLHCPYKFHALFVRPAATRYATRTLGVLIIPVTISVSVYLQACVRVRANTLDLRMRSLAQLAVMCPRARVALCGNPFVRHGRREQFPQKRTRTRTRTHTHDSHTNTAHAHTRSNSKHIRFRATA